MNKYSSKLIYKIELLKRGFFEIHATLKTVLFTKVYKD